MFNLFDKDFFKFFMGFMGILVMSLVLSYFADKVSKQVKAEQQATAIQPLNK